MNQTAIPVERSSSPERSRRERRGTLRTCLHVVVMGVSGSGKTTVASALARELRAELIEGDDHHPPANVEKMGAGIPLTDEDRGPWLETLARLLEERHARGEPTVLACSALKRVYRDVLRSAVPPEETFIVELDAEADILRQRMASRKGHFMPASLLESQLETLERLEDDERGIIVDAERPAEAVTADAWTAVEAFLRDD